MRITTHRKFDKAFVKLTPDQRTAVKQAIAAFETNHLDPNLRDHALNFWQRGAAHDRRVQHG